MTHGWQRERGMIRHARSVTMPCTPDKASDMPGPLAPANVRHAQDDEVTLPWELAGLVLLAFLLTILGLLWAFGNYPWGGEDNAYTLKGVGFLLASILLAGIAARAPFPDLLKYGTGALFVLPVLALIYLLDCLYIRSDGEWIFRWSDSPWQRPLLATIVALSPTIFVSVLSHVSEANLEYGLPGTTAFLVVASAALGCMAGSPEAATVSILTVLTVAWLAGLSNGLTVWILTASCIIGLALSSFTHPQPSATGDSAPWTPVAVSCGSIAQGRWLGAGLGGGLFPDATPQRFYDDFLFSLVGSEMGAVGALLLMALFLLFAVFGLRLAGQLETPHARLCVAGTTVSLLLPAILHFGICTATLPAGKMWLPFLTGGGGSLLVPWTALGIALAAVQHDVRSPGTFPGHFTLWRPIRVRVLTAVFAAAMALLAFRVISLATDQDTAQRFSEYVDESLLLIQDPSPLPPVYPPRPLEEDATQTPGEVTLTTGLVRNHNGRHQETRPCAFQLVPSPLAVSGTAACFQRTVVEPPRQVTGSRRDSNGRASTFGQMAETAAPNPSAAIRRRLPTRVPHARR